MIFVIKFIFFFCLVMIFYIYIGYPVLVFLIGMIKNQNVKKSPFEPHITILIAAYNEEGNIEATLRNKLELDYPKEKLEVIVLAEVYNCVS